MSLNPDENGENHRPWVECSPGSRAEALPGHWLARFTRNDRCHFWRRQNVGGTWRMVVVPCREHRRRNGSHCIFVVPVPLAPASPKFEVLIKDAALVVSSTPLTDDLTIS